ncbi:hypothetical protein [Rhodococcoides fascians]|uniref:hypothetical protein n=1 Tax=Rhodococcoides fascians TaxID=1828 RepID=UPI001E2AC354|nr:MULTISPECIES: hypothetical protein [Rhodococcus]
MLIDATAERPRVMKTPVAQTDSPKNATETTSRSRRPKTAGVRLRTARQREPTVSPPHRTEDDRPSTV